MTILYFLQQNIGLARRKIISALAAGELYINNVCMTDKDTEVHTGDIISLHEGESHPKAFIVEGEKKRKKKSEIILLNKPKGYVVSKDDPHNQTIFELFPPEFKKDRYYIGRLDKDSHGLVALTNQTPVVNRFEHPSSDIKKEYVVRIDKPFASTDVEKAKEGLRVDEQGYALYGRKKSQTPVKDFLRVARIKYKLQKNEHIVYITLTEGKKRHIRRLLRALGYIVKDLERISIRDYSVHGIRPGKRRKVPGPKIDEAL